MLIIGALALIVIGPKDLPILMRRVGQFVGKMRGMAAEFRASFDELARQSELDELRKEVEALRTGASLTGDVADPHGAGVFDEIKNNCRRARHRRWRLCPQPGLLGRPPSLNRASARTVEAAPNRRDSNRASGRKPATTKRRA